MDTLQIATDRSGQFRCVLVLVDAFSKWAEVVPLRHHDARSVAEAFGTVCMKWGPPNVGRVDNWTEFANAIVESLLETMEFVSAQAPSATRSRRALLSASTERS